MMVFPYNMQFVIIKGTCELDYATLEGGNSMGNTEEQCHITDLAVI